jgi:alkylhydroperoxidase family enzyme
VTASGISPIAYEDLPPELRAQLAPRVERLGYLGEFFQYAAHQPAALSAFASFTEALRNALAPEVRELVALTVATSTGNRYERHQHEQLCRKTGIAAEWVADVTALDPDRLAGADRLVQRLVLALLADHGRGVDDELAAVVAELGQETAVGVLLLTGRYQAHSLVANALRIAPPVPSIFDEVRQ